ncbi:MAG TPA: hypothetical protein PKH33_09450 [bacterium]|nr:hypothetical protein [bacterium]
MVIALEKAFIPLFAVMVLLFGVPRAVFASSPQSDRSYSTPLFVPEALTLEHNQPDPEKRIGVSIGTSYAQFGRIANVPSADVHIRAEGANYHALASVAGFDVSYVKQDYRLTRVSGKTKNVAKHEADIIGVGWESSPGLFRLPLNGGIALGSVMYFDDNGAGSQNFAQHRAAYTFRHGNRVSGRVGANWTTGDVENLSGALASVYYSVGDELTLYADYNSKDIHKLVFNRVILPSEGIDCSTCGDDALSVGMSFKIRGYARAVIGFYDVDDLMAPMAGISTFKEY